MYSTLVFTAESDVFFVFTLFFPVSFRFPDPALLLPAEDFFPLWADALLAFDEFALLSEAAVFPLEAAAALFTFFAVNFIFPFLYNCFYCRPEYLQKQQYKNQIRKWPVMATTPMAKQ